MTWCIHGAPKNNKTSYRKYVNRKPKRKDIIDQQIQQKKNTNTTKKILEDTKILQRGMVETHVFGSRFQNRVTV